MNDRESVIISHLVAGSLKEKICRICLREDEEMRRLDELIKEDEISTVNDMLFCIATLEV